MTALPAIANLPTLSQEGGLAGYLAAIRKFPMLTAEEEAIYARRWREDGDRQAAYRLVTAHLRLAAKIALNHRGYGLPLADLISEANLGLMQAVKRFEPDKGFRLSTYAILVDQGHGAGIRAAVVVAGKDRHHAGAEEAVLQPAQAEAENRRHGERRVVAGSGCPDRRRIEGDAAGRG
jgi:hypothetical protein